MSNKLVKEEQVLVLTDAIIKKINELGLKISENDSSFRGFIKPNSAAPILRGLYICEDSGVYVYFGQINVTADEINSGIVFIHYTGTAFNKVALPLTNFIKKTDLGKPNSAASLGADGLLSKEQRWEVAIDFNQENTPIWLNTPAPTKAGVFYPSESGTYLNYGNITISTADLNSNIVRIHFDGVSRFEKVKIGLAGQFLPLSGGEMQNAIEMNTIAGGHLLKGNFTGDSGNKLLYYAYSDLDGYHLEIAIPGINTALEKKIKITERGWLYWDGAINVRMVQNMLMSVPNLINGTRAYIVGSGGFGDNVLQFHKLGYNQYAVSTNVFNAEMFTTPFGDSTLWNSQTKKALSKYNLIINPALPKSNILIDLISVYATTDVVKVDITLIDTLSRSDKVGSISLSVVFQVYQGLLNRQVFNVSSISGKITEEYYVNPTLQVVEGRVCLSIWRKDELSNPLTARIEYTTSDGQGLNVAQPTYKEKVSELTTETNKVDFQYSPSIPNPTLAQDAIPMQWANDRFALKSNLSILDGKIGTIDRDLIAVQVATDINTVSLNTVSDTVTRQGQSIMQTNSDIGEVRRDYFSKISSNLQNITSPVVFDKLAVFKTVEVPYSRSLNAPVNNSVLADAIAEIPSGGIEVIYENQNIQPTEQLEIDLTEMAIKRVPTASFIYENENGLICMGDLNIATKLNLFTYELLMSDRPKFKMNAISKQLNDFKLYR